MSTGHCKNGEDFQLIQKAQIFGPSSAVCGNRWKIFGTQNPLILSVSDQESKLLTIGSLLGIYWEMFVDQWYGKVDIS